MPFVPTHLQSVGIRTDAYPGPLAAWMPRWLGRPGRLLSHRITDEILTRPFKRSVAAAQDALGLSGSPTASDGQPVLFGFSRHVVDVPADADRVRHATGYWFLPRAQAWEPPAESAAFLAAADRPVVSIGFGSMSSKDALATTEIVRAAEGA